LYDVHDYLISENKLDVSVITRSTPSLTVCISILAKQLIAFPAGKFPRMIATKILA
jgi:hypothetical protein